MGKLLAALEKSVVKSPPLWLMRQAGRYLPEYRQARARAGSFWKLCMTPELAAEVTLQPMRRYGFDAAILFSDILVVPYAFGREIAFEEGEGPRLDPVRSVQELDLNPLHWHSRLEPVRDAMRRVRAELSPETDLLGFCGAPWTLATYMAEGRGSTDQRAAKLWGYRDPEGFAQFLEVIERCVAQHLVAQLEAGATAVQLFDSWAGSLPEKAFAQWVIAPTRRIVDAVRAARPGAKIIGFPRVATLEGYRKYAEETGVDAVSLDTAVPLRWAVTQLGSNVTLQGNLDPILLIAGGRALERAVDELLEETQSVPFIAILGHGILPETPLEHVALLVDRIKGPH
jgi:uroporphyrinogen decarboxylase